MLSQKVRQAYVQVAYFRRLVVHLTIRPPTRLSRVQQNQLTRLCGFNLVSLFQILLY